MDTLSGLDASFLYLECPEMPMHVGSLHLYELPKGFRGSFHKAVQRHVASRLHLVPLFHRRLASMPLNLGHPAWVEAQTVDLNFHVRREPGKQLTTREVEQACAQLHGELLDRERPLWQFYIFDSVQAPAGKRYAAFYSKIHHAALDGKAGTVLANALLDLSPTPRAVAPAALGVEDAAGPSTASMVGEVLSGSMAQYLKLARSLPGALGALGSTVMNRVRGASAARSAGQRASASLLAPLTRFNAAVTPQRSFATASVPFADCRNMAKALGISFNDLVLWLCSTALRNYLARNDKLPRKSLIAAMPVSLRPEENQDLNTQASMTLVQLGTQYADPKKRLLAITASSGKVKDAMLHLKSVLPTDYPSLLAPWLVGGVASTLFKAYSATGLAKRLPMPSNVVISNVPGPQVALYLAGARMLTFHPLSIVMHGVALNMTIQTYAGSVDFGLIADARALPADHAQQLADDLQQAFHEAQRLFPQVPAPAGQPPGAAASAGKKQRAAGVAKATDSPVRKSQRRV